MTPQQAKKLLNPPPFKPDLYLKRSLAVSFWTDSNDLLWRANIFRQQIGYDNLSTKSKIYVDIIMAIECSLKSMIISLSQKNETPEAAYLTARNCSHHLNRLFNEVKNRAKNRVKFLSPRYENTIIKANSLGVGYRYDITGFMFLSQEDWVDRTRRTGLVSSVINHDFLDELNIVAHDLNSLSGNIVEKYYWWYARVNAARLKEITDRRTQFLVNLGRQF